MFASLPPIHVSDYLVTQYFDRLSSFFHVLHGPTFQKQYQAFHDNPSGAELSWLALLFLICSITVNTMEDNDPVLTEIATKMPRAHDTASVSYQYRTMAMICLCRDNFMVRHSLSTLEALLLLAYTITHNEGVDRSWALLGRWPSSPCEQILTRS